MRIENVLFFVVVYDSKLTKKKVEHLSFSVNAIRCHSLNGTASLMPGDDTMVL